MSEQRMSGEKRREAIVKAVLPLFAKQGFANTTTRELAEAAGVSEALLYKHFPSKESLYSEIQDFGCRNGDPAFEKIASMEPSTSSLVYIIYFLMRCISIGNNSDPIDWETRHRLVLSSCLDDGFYPRFLFNKHFGPCFKIIEKCMDAAEQVGDLKPISSSNQNRVLFAFQLAWMIGMMHLPEQPVIDYRVSQQDLLGEAVGFALRGIGVTEEALTKYYNPKALALMFLESN